ncbi:hypothetical protein [Paenibacillus massiliensis]|nr:hypothetical protein [Paenibacillus massiliensis]
MPATADTANMLDPRNTPLTLATDSELAAGEDSATTDQAAMRGRS